MIDLETLEEIGLKFAVKNRKKFIFSQKCS